MDFKEGDKVVLKSGGPMMTITALITHATTKEPKWAACQWFDEKKKLEEGQFLLVAIEKYETPTF